VRVVSSGHFFPLLFFRPDGMVSYIAFYLIGQDDKIHALVLCTKSCSHPSSFLVVSTSFFPLAFPFATVFLPSLSSTSDAQSPSVHPNQRDIGYSYSYNESSGRLASVIITPFLHHTPCVTNVRLGFPTTTALLRPHITTTITFTHFGYYSSSYPRSYSQQSHIQQMAIHPQLVKVKSTTLKNHSCLIPTPLARALLPLLPIPSTPFSVFPLSAHFVYMSINVPSCFFFFMKYISAFPNVLVFSSCFLASCRLP